MKICIVARHFAPENTIGAIRLTKFAKYLTRLGHEVTVYAMAPSIDIKDAILCADSACLERVFRLENGTFYRAVHDFFARRDPSKGGRTAPAAAPNRVQKKSRMAQILSAMYRIMWIWADRDFVLHYRANTKADRETYDIVFASWNTNAAHEIALDLIRRGRARAFVADYRDACVSVWPELTKNRDTKRLMRRVYEKAALVTLAFPSLIKDNAVPDTVPSAIVYNGFDAEDLSHVGPAPAPDGKMHLAYCGQIYSGQQDFSPLFQALSDLIHTKKIDPNHLAIDYIGQSEGAFFSQCGNETVRDLIHAHGFLPREQVLPLERSADILLFAAWNSAQRPAIFPAKFLEYMLMDRPVLALIAGEVPGSLPKTVMDQTNLGHTYEAVGGEPAMDALKEWLCGQYQRFLSGEALSFHPNREAVAAYSYQTRTGELAALFKNCFNRSNP